ncbi:unnamed protein product [Cylicostephanus goldi]|uniref:Uncharacterized protein n=1 Tax=Cylicostephanus goldi TaxID=71465 RepID=A0A3P6T574_CYLGO|nr:unnamed protein product [Cylicostephanus goldi]
MSGDREADILKLIAEGRRYLGLPHLFWGIWNILFAQEHKALEDMDYDAQFKDRIIMYFKFKPNMYKY